MNEELLWTTLELDAPDARDYKYEELFWANNEKKEWYVVFYPPHIQNQGLKPRTRMACSRYGMSHAVNAQNSEVAKIDGMRWYEIPAEGQWENYLKVNAAAEREWATLQSALKQFLDLWFITGYSQVETIEQMKQALREYKPIYTGSKVGDWRAVTNEKKYKLRTDGRFVGHCFCIVGFDGAGWVAINSYGSSDGVFHIPYELTESLFTRYAISDSRDVAVFASKQE